MSDAAAWRRRGHGKPRATQERVNRRPDRRHRRKGPVLPVYSPDLTPSEMMWRKVKAWLRAAEARTHPDLLVAIIEALNRVTAQDALNWSAAFAYSFISTALAPSALRPGPLIRFFLV